MFENDQVTDQVERVNHLHMFELSIWIEMEKHSRPIKKRVFLIAPSDATSINQIGFTPTLSTCLSDETVRQLVYPMKLSVNFKPLLS